MLFLFVCFREFYSHSNSLFCALVEVLFVCLLAQMFVQVQLDKQQENKFACRTTLNLHSLIVCTNKK